MKIIRVMETGNNIHYLYEHAETPNQRALLGYIIRKGYTDDLVLGGAFHLLREIERANAHNVVYRLSVESQYGREIIEYAELAQQGAFNRFTLSAREVRKCIRLMEL